MDSRLHQVADLEQSARAVVETLVVHELKDDQLICVTALDVQPEALPHDRSAAWDELQSVLMTMQQAAAKSGLSPAQFDALIDEECAAVRYDRHP